MSHLKHLLALLCLMATGTVNAEMIETALIYNFMHFNEFQGVHTTDSIRADCKITWTSADRLIYDTAEFRCRLYIGDMGPGVPGTLVNDVFKEDPSPYDSLSVFGDVAYSDFGTYIVPGCGDKKWRLETVWKEIREPDNRPPFSETGTAFMQKVITWIQ